MTRITPLLAIVSLLAMTPARATGSAITIASVIPDGTRVTVTGSSFIGGDLTGPLEILTDPEADDADAGLVPNGLDLSSGTIAIAPDGKVIFTLETFDMPPVASVPAPTFVYNWNVAVDEVDQGYFVQAGYVGGWATANAGPFFNVCRRAGEVTCTSLGNAGEIGNNTVTVRVPAGQFGAKPGSTIGPGSAGGTTCLGVCSTWQPIAAVLYNTGGDQADAMSYLVPGGVQLTVVPEGTDDDAIDWSEAVLAKTQPGGGFSGTFRAPLPLDSGTTYEVAARTCGGAPAGPTCVVARRSFTA